MNIKRYLLKILLLFVLVGSVANADILVVPFYEIHGNSVYYRTENGLEKLQNADAKTFEIFKESRSFGRDKNNVYYLGDKLNKIDPKTFEVVEGYYITMFKDKNGIYKFEEGENEQDLKITPINAKIDFKNLKELDWKYFGDDKNIYYLHSYNIYRKKRTKHGYIDILVSKNIGIFSLGEKKDWEKIKDIDFGTVGQVWRKGNKYYYFDDLGVYQLIDDVVYEIVDNASLKYLLETNNINDDTIREFVRDKKLIAFKGEEVSTASVKYKESHRAEIFLAVFLTTFFGISILMISLKWKAQKKDREKLEEERKKIEKQMEFWDNYYNNNEEEKKEDEKIPTSYKSYDDEEEIKKEIDKIKPIVKNSDDIEGLKKREKQINSVIKNFNFDELDEEEK